MNKKIILSLSVIGIVAAIVIGGTIAYFTDTETSEGNTFTAGTLDLSIPESDNPQEFPVSFTDMVPGEWTEKQTLKLKNTGSLTHVIDRIQVSGIEEKDQKFTVSTDTGKYSLPANITVEDLGDKVKWTIDMDENDGDFTNKHAAYALVISHDGVEPAYQIHSNDGTDSTYAFGTHLYSEYDNGWHTGDTNTPISWAGMDWVSANGQRDLIDNPDLVYTVTIDKSELGDEFYWGLALMGNTSDTKYPDSWGEWSGNASGLAPAKFNINIGPNNFAQKINVKVYHNDLIREGTLWNFYKSGDDNWNMIKGGNEITLDPGEEGWYNFEFQLDPSVTNDYQGDGIEATFEVEAVQEGQE